MNGVAGSVKRVAGLLVLMAILGGIGFMGYRFFQDRQYSAKAAQELTRQESEARQCRERLAQIHGAWSKYRTEHKGAVPPSLEALLPQYLKPELMVCPTAGYWIGKKMSMEQGSLKLGGRDYPVTYGARWLTSSYARAIKTDKERAPIVVCESHVEALYKTAYQRRPPLGAFSDEQRVNWIPEVRDAKALVLLANGDVVEMLPASL